MLVGHAQVKAFQKQGDRENERVFSVAAYTRKEYERRSIVVGRNVTIDPHALEQGLQEKRARQEIKRNESKKKVQSLSLPRLLYLLKMYAVPESAKQKKALVTEGEKKKGNERQQQGKKLCLQQFCALT